ncbi:MAG: hypothetical protein AB1531_06090 [Chloroflexota bacterium]
MNSELTPVSRILTNHCSRYPYMQVRDVYKLLLQAALGCEHAVRDETSAQEWLERELAEMGAGPDEPLFDPVSPDGEIVRVHLRPYFRAGRDPQKLLQAFVQTFRVFSGSRDTFQAFWREAIAMCMEGSLPFEKQALETFFDEMKALGFPAAHHSEDYIRLYHPAYRVVARELMEEV